MQYGPQTPVQIVKKAQELLLRGWTREVFREGEDRLGLVGALFTAAGGTVGQRHFIHDIPKFNEAAYTRAIFAVSYLASVDHDSTTIEFNREAKRVCDVIAFLDNVIEVLDRAERGHRREAQQALHAAGAA